MWLGYVYLNNSLRRGKKYCKRFDFITNGYGVPSTGGSFSTIHWDSATQYLNKETKRTFGHSAQAISDIHTVKKIDKNFTYSQQEANITQLVEKLTKKLLMVFCMHRKLETNISKLFSKRS